MQPDPMLGRILGGTFAIERPLGSGGFGAVYVGRHNRTGKEYAVKVLRPDRAATSREAVARFRREAQALAALGHPGIVAIHDFATTEDGVDYLVMDLLAGEDLAHRLTSAGCFELPAALAIVEQIGAALSVAHDAGIVHRDLKPANVFLTKAVVGMPERALVLDFGLAKMVEPEGAESLTTTGAPMGTPLYMAPEQARGEQTDARTDQYALATILFEMLTGGPPFKANSVPQIMVKLLTTPPPVLNTRASVPSHVDAAVSRALRKRPDERFDHMTHFIAALGGDPAHLQTPATTHGQTLKARADTLGLAETHTTPVEGGPARWTGLHGSGPARGGRSLVPLAIAGGLLAALAVGTASVWVLMTDRPAHVATLPDPVHVPVTDHDLPALEPSDTQLATTPETDRNDRPTMPETTKRSRTRSRTKRRVTSPRVPPAADPPAAPEPPASQAPHQPAAAPQPPARTARPAADQEVFRDQARQAEHQASEIRALLQQLPALRQAVSGLAAGREPALCGASVRGRLRVRSDVSTVVSAVQRIRREVERVCERFARLDNPSPEVRHRLRAIAPTLERAREMTRSRISSNQPEAVARETERTIDEARHLLDGVAEGRRPFPCAAGVWSKLRRLSTGANSYAGAAARRVTQMRGQICSAINMRPERLRQDERTFNEHLDAIERGLRQNARTQEELARRLRAALESVR